MEPDDLTPEAMTSEQDFLRALGSGGDVGLRLVIRNAESGEQVVFRRGALSPESPLPGSG
jgi:hypothetical protein